MNECIVDVPMILNTRSVGQKKSTFIAYFDSDYDGWFYDTINFNAAINTEVSLKTVAQITSGVDDAVFSLRRNENELISTRDVTIDADETKYIVANTSTTLDDVISLTTPYKMKELNLAPIAGSMSGVVDLTTSGWTTKGNMLKTLILGSEHTESNVSRIVGLHNLQNLNYLNISYLDKLVNTPAISTLSNINVLDARKSNITAFKPKANSYIYDAWLPETLKTIKLDNIKFRNGTLNVMGEETDFFGRMNYVPNANLNSFTCSYTNAIDTYTFVSSWISALKEADKLKLSELIYLELNGINWPDTPIEMMYDLKKFDLDVNESTSRKGLSGDITIHGTGNYGLMTTSEYSDILKMYGRQAFTGSGNEKVFSDLNLHMWGNMIEPYDFYLNVTNISMDETTHSELRKPRPVELNYSYLTSLNPPMASISFLEVLHKNSKIYFKDHLGSQVAVVNIVNPRTFGAYGAPIPYVFWCYTKNLSTWKEELLKKNILLRVLDPIKFFALFKPQVRLVENRRIKSVETIN